MAGLVPSDAIEPDWPGDVCLLAGWGPSLWPGLNPSPQSRTRGGVTGSGGAGERDCVRRRTPLAVSVRV
jgi:hypothetical protein